MTLAYSDYLKIPDLMKCQQPLSVGPEHDEMLFIIIHQVYELWFKQIIHESGRLQQSLESGDANVSRQTLNRILKILKTLVSQIDILETMTPLSFLSFRDRLGVASGFQSRQFREFEFLLGKRDTDLVELHKQDPEDYAIVQSYLSKPSVYDSLLRYLDAVGFAIPQDVLERDLSKSTEPSKAIQQELIKVYRTHDEASTICELLVDLDEGVQEWRYRHVKMVERTIGTKIGTGGSTGAEYLLTTLFKPLFPDLWAIRLAF